MRKTALILAPLALLSAAQARFFLGFPASGIYASDALSAVFGVHFGTYNLYDDFGIRATAEAGGTFSSTPGLIVEGGVDGLYSFGEGAVFYTGAGLGYKSQAPSSNIYTPGPGSSLFISAFVGLDFDASSVISIFLEINPRYTFTDVGLLHLRSGINFHIGDPDDNPVTQPDAGTPWLEPYDPGGSGQEG